MKLVALLAFLAARTPSAAAAQASIIIWGTEEVDAGEFAIDLQRDPSAYAGSYRFGDSEGEATFRLSVQGHRVTGRLTYAVWKNNTWELREVRLDEGRIEGAMLIAPGWSGVFVRWDGTDYERGGRGLVLFRSLGQRLDGQFGYRMAEER
jgi:hypothetical protein